MTTSDIQSPSDEPTLRLEEVAAILGITHGPTKRNWLSQGYFPGAVLGADGHRRFSPAGVSRVQARTAAIEEQNRAGIMAPMGEYEGDPYADMVGIKIENAATRETCFDGCGRH
jgi:hypothetical protein